MGQETWLVKNTSVFFENQGVQIRVLILQNIIPLNSIAKWDQNYSITQYKKWRDILYKGVIILFLSIKIQCIFEGIPYDTEWSQIHTKDYIWTKLSQALIGIKQHAKYSLLNSLTLTLILSRLNRAS